jgi:hypothetical protein
MLLLRRGSVLSAVRPNFRATAITEITFLPASPRGGRAIPAVDALVLEETVTLAPVVEGAVQTETEERLLESLLAELAQLEARTGPDEVLVIENEPGVDWPRTRETRSDILDPMGNRLHFRWHVEPPLRIGRYRLPSS